MAIRIKFDSNYNAQQPTLVLMTKSGRKLGKIPAVNMQFKDAMNTYSEGRFDLYKADSSATVWQKAVDFKLVWAKEWNAVYELTIDKKDTNGELKKPCYMTSLGESELSQINLYNIQINTEDDIARDDYKPTVLYKEDDPEASLLNRIMEKAPHYTIKHVDNSIAGIQRTFEWDGRSIYDAFMEISEEIGCLFQIRCYLDGEDDDKLKREISIYDLMSVCLDCGERGEFLDVCDSCGSTNIMHGYGEDTTILVSTENLADEITLTTDTGSVKNCMKMESGDEYMDAAIASCNPNGSMYIWYLGGNVRDDMSPELVEQLDAYDALYKEYQTTHSYSLPSSTAAKYNGLILKYQAYTQDYERITNPLIGYPALNEKFFEAISFYYYLSHSLMPDVSMSETTASDEVSNLQDTLSSTYSDCVSVMDSKSLANLSVTTANSTVVQLAKTIVNPAYKVSISGTSTVSSAKVWSGTVAVTNYSDETDTDSVSLTLTFDDNYENYLSQTINYVLSNSNTDELGGMTNLFNRSNSSFSTELGKYSLAYLSNVYNACQACVDLLIQQGVADGKTWGTTLYNDLYKNGYYAKLKLIEAEIKERETEVQYVSDMMNAIESHRIATQDLLNLENYLGETLWLEFSSYRREDVYQNSNYISDGLSDDELFANALQFYKIAEKELFKAAELQHQISALLKNLLVMREFRPIVDHFEVGNWLRAKIDGEVYRLRLLDYEINYSNLNSLSVTFSDVMRKSGTISDLKNVLDQASSMASSYDSVKRQADKGGKGYRIQNNWVANGLNITNTKIVSNPQNQDIVWDEHGMLFREYYPTTEDYDDTQLKIINQGLYVTDDAWGTAKAGIGKFMIWNPISQQNETKYGVIADTVVGRIILGEEVYIANSSNTFSVNDNGLSISNGTNSIVLDPNAEKLMNIQKGSSSLFYLDDEGDLNVVGKITATALVLSGDASISGAIDATEGSIAGWTISPNTLTSGTLGASSSMHLGTANLGTATIAGTELSTWRLTVGANFGVTNAGALYSSSAHISGEITASTGYIGGTNGWIITTNAIYKGTSSMTSTTAGTFIGTAGIRQYNSSTAYVNIANGTITAKGADISGTVTATAGSIAGWTLNSNSFYKNTSITSGSTETQYQALLYAPSDAGATTYAFRVRNRAGESGSWSTPFYVRYDGYLHASNAHITGEVTANTGYIGGTSGWMIASQKLSSGTYGSNGSLYLGTANLGSATFAGTTSSAWRLTVGSNFGVTSSGALYCGSATIVGTITANSGYIGGTSGWRITSKAIYNGTSSMGSTTAGTYIGTAGIRNYASSSKYVNITNGILTASGASISGDVTATAGKVGGWTIGTNTIQKTTTVSGTQYTVKLYAPSSPKATDAALEVVGAASSAVDTRWHYYGETHPHWESDDGWETYYWVIDYVLEKDDGTRWVATENEAYANCSTFPTVETRGDHSTSTSSKTRILYNGTLETVEFYYTNMHQNSDRELKKDIEYLNKENSARFTYSLKPVRYRYKYDDTILHHGLIAQDVEESALYDDWNLVSEDYKGYKSLTYIEIISDLIATVQTLNDRLKILEADKSA